jgi:hypothetical protein
MPAVELMSTELAALVGESYERAYTDMVRLFEQHCDQGFGYSYA